jgi:uncharacterized protein (UPF0335 family)
MSKTENAVLSNSEQILKARVERRLEVMETIADGQQTLKDYKAEDKADGFTEKAIGQIIKELQKGVDFQAAQLLLETEVDSYRKVNGLPVTLEDAQKRALSAAEVAEPKRKASRGKKGKDPHGRPN